MGRSLDKSRDDSAHEGLEGERLASGHLDLPAIGQTREELQELCHLFIGGVALAGGLALNAVRAVVIAMPAYLPFNRRAPHSAAFRTGKRRRLDEKFGLAPKARPVTASNSCSPYF